MQESTAKRLMELKATGKLPSPTGVAQAILELTQRDDVSNKEIAKVVQADPALTGRLLKFANSPIIGFSRPVASIEDALVLLGVRVVRQLALGLSVLSNSLNGPCRQFDYPGFWSTSLATALAAQALCTGNKPFPPEEVFTCGLLCQVGRLALASLYPDIYGEILETHSTEVALVKLEQKKINLDHLELTTALLHDWGLPEFQINAVYHHETPTTADLADNSRSTILARILHLANKIGNLCTAKASIRPSLSPTLLNLAEQEGYACDALDVLFADVVRQWNEWGRLLDVPTVDVPTFTKLMEMAQNKLQASLPKPEQPSLRILAVDDEPSSLEILSVQLQQAGHYVLTARNGREALKQTLENHPQIIITDWLMPEMDGPTLCKALREARLGQLLYIIMLTSHDDEAHLIKAFEAGADDYIIKPFIPAVLEARLRGAQRLIRLQEEVERERQESHRYLDTVQVMIVGLDEHGSITLLNRTGAEILGRTERQLLGQDWFTHCIPEQLRESLHDSFATRMSEIPEALIIEEYPISTVNGEERLIAWRHRIVRDTAGRVSGMLSAGEDITEQKRADAEHLQLQRQLQQAQKMQAIGQLTGGIAHDFNNILSAVMGYTELAEERASEYSDPKLLKYLQQISNSSKRAQNLVEQMLAFSRGGIGKPKNVSLPPLVKEVVKMLDALLPSSMTVKTQIEQNLPTVVLDPVQLQQVIMNLCINARDAMAGNGTLSISVQRTKLAKGICVSCHSEFSGDYIELAVTDTGDGIPQENLTHIFEPFFSTKEVGKGAGMGLSMVHGIVHKMGGHMLLESHAGNGACFKVLLPHP